MNTNQILLHGTLIVAISTPIASPYCKVLLLKNPPANAEDRKRSRPRIGCGRMVFPGGLVESTDRDSAWAAHREFHEEVSGLRIDFSTFRQIGVLDVYESRQSDKLFYPDNHVWKINVFMVRIPANRVSSCRPGENHEFVQWSSIRDLPYRKMMPGDDIWCPKLMLKKPFHASLFREKSGAVTAHRFEKC
jgi:8-oxo-dGTP pyrophosphatase MutT (NUDIX family)